VFAQALPADAATESVRQNRARQSFIILFINPSLQITGRAVAAVQG
jgi:hypothetical protein